MDVPHSLRINSQPLYLQAIDAIRALIEQKVYRPGDMLPPEETLARQMGISRLTLREALGYLENDGLIERRRGVGTIVRASPRTHFAGGLERIETLRSLARAAGFTARTTFRQVSVIAAAGEWATRLEVPAGTELVRVQVTQDIDGRTAAHFDSVAPLTVVDLDDLGACDGSLLEYQLERRGQPLSHSRSVLQAINAGRAVAAILGVAEGAAVLQLSETFYLPDRRPICLSENYFLTGAFNFYISRRGVGRTARHR